ncbi:hypothetical protein NQ317_005801 [Molorchus minor]|uniref:Double jelly roll-like domain-containing protein n=1 Tax=Molorchus minor TaxID=1323400 RepID=A0ABQ9JL95_9CUCU|nr:hypothetical protein NQ317_005801 [Molorchus minor]
MKQELVLIRSSNDLDCIYSNDLNELPKITITKLFWKVPHVSVSMAEQLRLTKLLNKNFAMSTKNLILISSPAPLIVTMKILELVWSVVGDFFPYENFNYICGGPSPPTNLTQVWNDEDWPFLYCCNIKNSRRIFNRFSAYENLIFSL